MMANQSIGLSLILLSAGKGQCKKSNDRQFRLGLWCGWMVAGRLVDRLGPVLIMVLHIV